MNWIPDKLYTSFLAMMPYCCIDLVIVRDKQYLLVQRKQEPLKGEWYLPGGRLFKDESVMMASIRIANGEVGLNPQFIGDLGYYMGYYDKSPFGFPIHTVSFVVLMESNRKKVTLDRNHSAYMWTNELSDAHKNILSFIKKVKSEGWI